MNTSYFASAERSQPDELLREISEISTHPLVDALMNVVGGLFAVLNEHRQILTVNQAMLNFAGYDDPECVLGLRPGEFLGCIHANDMATGCGTSESCRTCGATQSLVRCMAENSPQEQRFVLAVSRAGDRQDLVLQVRSVPLQVGNRKFFLLFLLDITQRQNWAALESTFFHDVGNLLTGLIFSAETMVQNVSEDQRPVAIRLLDFSERIAQEFSIHRSLVRTGAPAYQILRSSFQASRIVSEIAETYLQHPKAAGKHLDYSGFQRDFSIHADYSLVMRILHNMIVNAFENSNSGAVVKFTIERDEDGVFFSVWNHRAIPPEMQLRIFQRNFTTKNEDGHGLGTFSMKLFGEQYLGGKVGFTSDADLGTEFTFFLPQSVEA